MVAPTCFGITLPSSGSVLSVFWEMLNWGAVDRILWMGVLCLVTCYVCTTSLGRPQNRLNISENNNLLVPPGIEHQNIHAAVWSLNRPRCCVYVTSCLLTLLSRVHAPLVSTSHPLWVDFSPSEIDRHQQRASACSCTLYRLTLPPPHFYYTPHIPCSGIIPTPFFTSNNQPPRRYSYKGETVVAGREES
jgi:hypothetical protein